MRRSASRLLACLLLLGAQACSQYEEIYYIPADSFRMERIRLEREGRTLSVHVREVAHDYLADARQRAERAVFSAQHEPDECVGECPASADETTSRQATQSENTAPRRATQTSSNTRGAPININTASARQLERLPRVGPATARLIIESRPYTSIEDIMRVRGIGPATFAQIREKIRVHDE